MPKSANRVILLVQSTPIAWREPRIGIFTQFKMRQQTSARTAWPLVDQFVDQLPSERRLR